MKQTPMSLPDLLLQAFVILMCGWGIYNKWIVPRVDAFRKKRVLPKNNQLLSTMLMTPDFKQDVATPTASTPVITSPDQGSQWAAVVVPIEDRNVEEGDDEEEEEYPPDWESDTQEDVEEQEEENDEPEEELTSTEPIESVRTPPPVSFPRFVSAKKSDPNAAWNGFVSKLLSATNHLIVIGASGGGKTVTMYDFVRWLLDVGMQVIVCDPDAAQGDWPGADVYGGGDDFDSINGVLAGLKELMMERRQLRTQGVREFEPIWFVFDEYSDIKDECDLADGVVENGLRRARKLNIHLMIGVQDTQVKTMGFERKSSLLEHARIIKLIRRLDDSRILRLDDETTIKVPRFDLAVPDASEDVPSTSFRAKQPHEIERVPGIRKFGGERDDKEAAIIEAINEGWTYGRMIDELGTSSARISRIKRKMSQSQEDIMDDDLDGTDNE